MTCSAWMKILRLGLRGLAGELSQDERISIGQTILDATVKAHLDWYTKH